MKREGGLEGWGQGRAWKGWGRRAVGALDTYWRNRVEASGGKGGIARGGGGGCGGGLSEKWEVWGFSRRM